MENVADTQVVAYDTDMVRRIRSAVQDADMLFESSGGSTKHWVRECFLPALENADLKIVPMTETDRQEYTDSVLKKYAIDAEESFKRLMKKVRDMEGE